MIDDGKHYGFLVQMIGGSHLHAPDGYTEGRVLDSLEFLNHRSGSVRKPYGSTILEMGLDKGFVGNKDGFFLLTPVGTSKGFENVDTG